MEIKDPKMFAAFERYCEWKSLPRYFANYTSEQLLGKGLSEDLVELARIRFKKDFAEKFSVETDMLTSWDKHPDLEKKVKDNWKKWGKKLTPNLIGKFAEKLFAEGDAARMKLWFEKIEGEVEDTGVNVNIGFENILKAMREDNELPAIEVKPEIKVEETKNGEERK